MPEVKANKYTNADELNIAESEEAAVPVETTLADVVAGKNVCDLVTLKATLVKEVAVKEDGTTGSTTYYLQDGDNKIVCVNNSKNLNKIEEGTEIIVTGIVNTSKDAYQIKLTKSAEDTSGVNTLTADEKADNRIFNIAGQQVVKAQRGLYIIGGKKVIVK